MRKKAIRGSILKAKQWPALSRDKSVQLIAPGMAFDREDLKKSQVVLQDWGIKLHIPKDILGSHPVCSNSREVREQHLKAALLSDSSIVWAARGGYGSLHLVKMLSKMNRPKKQKLLIGFSDLTTLHQFFNQEWGWPSLHGPHVDRLYKLSPARLNELKSILFGQKEEFIYKGLKPLNGYAQRLTQLKTCVVGGNLITLQSTIGTSLQLNAQGKIIFLEDIGERGYRVDRVLEQMNHVGIFKTAKAVVFGAFTGGEEPNGPTRVPAVLKDFAGRVTIPVFGGLRVGHLANSQILPLNMPTEIVQKAGKFLMSVQLGSTF